MRKFFLLTLILTFPLFINAQEIKHKSAFTLNFIRYIGWSEEQTKGDFIIGVVGKKELADMLKEQSTGRKFGYQDIVIKEFTTVDKITPCHVLYVGKAAKFVENKDKVFKNSGNKNFLLITETNSAIESGSIINFVIENDILKFEISESNAANLGITYNSKLSSMSSAIKK